MSKIKSGESHFGGILPMGLPWVYHVLFCKDLSGSTSPQVAAWLQVFCEVSAWPEGHCVNCWWCVVGITKSWSPFFVETSWKFPYNHVKILDIIIWSWEKTDLFRHQVVIIPSIRSAPRLFASRLGSPQWQRPRWIPGRVSILCKGATWSYRPDTFKVTWKTH